MKVITGRFAGTKTYVVDCLQTGSITQEIGNWQARTQKRYPFIGGSKLLLTLQLSKNLRACGASWYASIIPKKAR